MPDPKLIDLALDYRYETARAYLVNDGHQDIWLPKSMTEKFEADGGPIFTIPIWLAKEKGLI